MLFAQASVTGSIANWLIVVVVVVPTVLLFVFMLATALLRHFRAHRELLHAERMRAIEAGLPLDVSDQTKLQAKSMHNAFWISFWLAFGLPATAFWAAASATRQLEKIAGLALTVWICTALATIGAVVCATVLMMGARHRRTTDDNGNRKPPQPQ